MVLKRKFKLQTMKKLESIFRQEISDQEQLFSKVKMLKTRFPNIGIVCNGMKPIERKIEICNATEPPAMQFRPKDIEEMKKLATDVKETSSNFSIHLDDPKFNKETGTIDQVQKEKLAEIMRVSADSNNFKLNTIHPGWKDASLILDEQGNWRETILANTVASELADLFVASIKANKVMAIENVNYQEGLSEKLGTKPEHLIAMRSKLAQVISEKTGLSVDEVLSKIGYTFDIGHAAKNAHLSKQYPIEAWLKQLGKDIKLFHIHDVLPPEALPDNTLPEDSKNRYQREHKSLGRGIIDWKSFFQLKDKYCPNIPMILEINNDGTGAKTVESIKYLEQLEQKL